MEINQNLKLDARHISYSYILLHRYELDNLYKYYIGKTNNAYEKFI